MNPTEIQEDWESREKVKLTFKNGEEEHTIYPKVHDDWADMQGLLKYVNNRVLAPVDYQFYYGTGGDIFVIGLTLKEKEELSNLTGIEFEEIK